MVSETNGSWGNATHLFTTSCVVPVVVGKTLSAAKNRLSAADCGIGKITKAYSKAKKGRVIRQRRRGTLLKAGAKVALTVSKGEKP